MKEHEIPSLTYVATGCMHNNTLYSLAMNLQFVNKNLTIETHPMVHV